MENIIITKNLYKIYGEWDEKFEALIDINLEIKEGEFLGFMGSSGSGKTTLVNILSTLDQHSKGKVFIGRENIEKEIDFKKKRNEELSEFRRVNIGFVFQNYNLLEIFTNRENIEIPLKILNMNVNDINSRVENLAEKLGVEHILDKYPSECSGGEKQRISIARALSTNPKIIFADEPTDSLDMRNSIEVLKILRKLNEELKITIVLVTHDHTMASFCNRVLLIDKGEIKTEIINNFKRPIEFYNQIMDRSMELYLPYINESHKC